jgi:hypothetical protein
VRLSPIRANTQRDSARCRRCRIHIRLGARAVCRPGACLPPIAGWWLVLVALVVQYVAIGFPPTHNVISQSGAAVALSISLALLLTFVWLNRRYSAFWVMGAGLLLNMAVIALNGGLMPISPATLQRLYPGASVDELPLGQQVGPSKNVLLLADETRLELLADRFYLPAWGSYAVAYSLGDVLIAIGVFWFLWQMGGQHFEIQQSAAGKQ